MSVVWLWSGAITDTTARVRTKVTGSSVRLAVADNALMSGPTFYGPVVPDGTGVATLEATGLTADSRWWYQIEDDSVLDTSITGQFQTFAPAGTPFSFTFVASGDAGLVPDFPGVAGGELAPSRISNHPVFDNMRLNDGGVPAPEHPHWFAHMGDMHYYNLGADQFGIVGGGSLANFRHAYDDVLGQPNQQALYRDVPIVYIYDDHDFGPNDSDGSFVDKANTVQVYREYVPHYPLAQLTGALYHSFTAGRILYIVTDGRYDRDTPSTPDPRTYLGAAQKAWLENLFQTTSAEYIIWQSAQPINSLGVTSWGGYNVERQEIFQMVRDTGWSDRLLMISADQHWLALDSGAHTAGFPLFTLAPIDASPTVGNSSGYDQGVRSARGQYGRIEVHDQGGTIRIRVRGLYLDGTVNLWKQIETFSVAAAIERQVFGFDYAQGHIAPPFEPTEDDQALRNDVIAERPDGSSARVEQTTGPLSTNPPPAGVGRYDESVSVNVADDEQLGDQASWRVHLGTVDEPRHPSIATYLHRNVDLAPDVAILDSGDRVTVSNVPEGHIPPGDVDVLVQGYTERHSPFEWEWATNTSPASPWTVGVLDHAELGRLDTSGSELAADVPADVVLNSNTGFETDTAGWLTSSFGSSTFTRSTAQAFEGVASGLIDPDGVAAFPAIFQGATIRGPVTEGVTYTAAPWVFSPNGYTDVRVRIDWGDAGGTIIANTSNVTTNVPAGVWTRLSASSGVAPAGAVTGGVRVILGGTPLTTDLLYVDKAELKAAGSTQFDVVTTGVAVWVDSAGFADQFPFDIKLGGEVMTVTAISGTASPQTFTVTRAVNGVVKSHTAGTELSLAQPLVLAL